MSYLHTPRLVFTGDFLSDVSTINNDPAKYNNSTFQPSFQTPGLHSANGWWNPEGGAIYNLQDCSIKQAVYKDGTKAEANDELIGQFVKCADGRASGKMVDLDPQMQMCSELWGMKLRIMNNSGDLLMSGILTTVGFRNLQYRQTAGIGVNGQPLGGSWPTTLTDIEWGDTVSENQFMTELKETTQQNKLSVNLNGFGYYYNHASNGRFSLGRMLGAIGPWFEGEPETISPSRKLYGVVDVGGIVYFNSTNFIMDRDKVVFDFGQSFPISNSVGRIEFNQRLIAAVSKKPLENGSGPSVTIDKDEFEVLDDVRYETGDNWLMDTGGILSINISEDGLKRLKDNQLLLLTINASGEYVILAREAIGGYVAKADNFVQRIDADQSATVRFYAWQWGRPIPNRRISVKLEPETPMQPISTKYPIYPVPGINRPRGGITFDETITTNEKGLAEMSLIGNRVNQPRDYLPGQIYLLQYELAKVKSEGMSGILPDKVNIHLRSYFPIPESPTWDDIAYEMTQFSNLYPIMSKYFIDLSDPHALIAKSEILTFAFTREITDPLYMPVTRDLSDSKRLTIVKWLQNPIIDGPKKDKKISEMTQKEEELVSVSESGMRAKEAIELQKQLKKLTDAKNGAMQNFQELKSLNY